MKECVCASFRSFWGIGIYRQAHSLAKEAASEPSLADNFQVQWLTKATYDRWMLSIGKEQKYDTQGRVSFELK